MTTCDCGWRNGKHHEKCHSLSLSQLKREATMDPVAAAYRIKKLEAKLALAIQQRNTLHAEYCDDPKCMAPLDVALRELVGK